MSSSINDTYLEARVMAASPAELVGLLYDAAKQAVREARRHLAAGDIRSRSREISRACDLVAELASSLDMVRGGQIAARLAALYDYIGQRLIDANLRQTDEPLAEVSGLLHTLGEAWDTLAGGSLRPQAPAGFGAFMGDSYQAMASQSWSA